MPTDSGMQQAQEEAVRRMQEMQHRAQPAAAPKEAPAVSPREPTILEQLSRDKDRTIILALVLLLGSEPASGTPDLLVALLFLLL